MRSKGEAADDIRGSEGPELEGKRIVLCVSGSVAAYRAIELARLLIRRGADVTCVLSVAATRLIRSEYFRWATGNAPITRLTGKMEHIGLADYGRSDMVIVYPATANTIGKLAGGIDDSPVSTVLTVALGSKIPIIVCMAMHASMHSNPAVRRNVAFLKGHVELVAPAMVEGKAKAPEPADVVLRVMERLGKPQPLRGKKALVIAGPTMEQIDPVRSVISHSSGKTGTLIAAELIAAGASVRMVYGPGCAAPPSGARVISTVSAAQMGLAMRKELRAGADIVVMAAAVSDYAPVSKSRSKFGSGKRRLEVRLESTPKLINTVKRLRPGAFLVGFKAESGISRARLEVVARGRMIECGADMMVANDVIERAQPKSRILIVDADSAKASKLQGVEAHARLIRAEIESRLKL